MSICASMVINIVQKLQIRAVEAKHQAPVCLHRYGKEIGTDREPAKPTSRSTYKADRLLSIYRAEARTIGTCVLYPNRYDQDNENRDLP